MDKQLEKEQEKQHKEKKVEKPKQNPYQEKVMDDVKIIRILSKDIRGNKKAEVGLMAIRGLSWMFINAMCKKIGINKNKKIQDLSKEEIERIEKFVKNPELPLFLLNRRKDMDTGMDKHLYGSDLDLQKEFDIKRLKKIKCYKGIRHTLGQPVRGQRTKAHFRKRGGANTGIKKKTEEKVK